jgi:hypothetical protein
LTAEIDQLEQELWVNHRGIVESTEGPEEGHRFRFAVASAGSYAVFDDKGGVGPHHDTELWGSMRTIEVRAWSLKEAIEKLAEVPFQLWFEDPS